MFAVVAALLSSAAPARVGGVDAGATVDCAPGPDDTAVWFRWRPSFHDPIDICVRRSAAGIVLVAKRGSMDGVIEERRQRQLTAAQWEHLERAIAAARLASIPPRTLADRMKEVDGSIWGIEVSDHGARTSAVEWTPSHDAFRALGELLFDLAGRDMLRGPVY